MESFNPNKHLKEQFVSNLTGSSKLEILFLITNFSILILIRHCIGFNLNNSGYVKKDDNASGNGKNLKAYIAALTVDFLCIAVPYVLFMTVLAERIYGNTILLVVLLLFLRTFFSFYITFGINVIFKNRNQSSFSQDGGINSIKPTISSYRVSMMLGTCLSILAVDFKIFPRRYAKTETYGTSLVHVGEYGVHWNFFFTLAAVAILTLIINVNPNYCGFLGSFILIAYQALLSCGLNKYLLSEERKTDIFSQNKEGIFSIFGYWGMYLLGVRIGSYLFFGNDAVKTKKRARTRVWALCLFFWSITLLLDLHVEKVSRRMCNLAYVSLTLATNLQVLAILMLSDDASGCKSSALEEAFNRNLLASFLLANVLTGLVNLSVDTLSVSSISALAILFAYAFLLSFAVGFADFLGIKLKFW
ncbi:uncharacterized protein at4g17910 [Phtheirospermum japonicum]|uniref:Uncharacterized protein at4g17910 n=1 Tax=Phtheirospermum japonicum TaxID=374723 RepID=A0A830CLL1_9LAMI|nr:uncharacterized protein at4g17910 [Phtheirospermum japonicum]